MKYSTFCPDLNLLIFFTNFFCKIYYFTKKNNVITFHLCFLQDTQMFGVKNFPQDVIGKI